MTLGLTGGELFVVVFITVAVVSAPWWPRLGGAIAELFVKRNAPPPGPPPAGE